MLPGSEEAWLGGLKGDFLTADASAETFLPYRYRQKQHDFYIYFG